MSVAVRCSYLGSRKNCSVAVIFIMNFIHLVVLFWINKIDAVEVNYFRTADLKTEMKPDYFEGTFNYVATCSVISYFARITQVTGV
jgi:hypothetical protein